MEIIGETEKDLIVLKKGIKELEIFLYNTHHVTPRSGGQLLLRQPPTKFIRHASLQPLSTTSTAQHSLLVLVYEELTTSSKFTANLFLIENLIQSFNDSPNVEKFASIVILDEILLVKAQSRELRIHILPPKSLESDASFPLADTPCLPTPGGMQMTLFRNQVIALSLEECITVYEIETTLSLTVESKIEIISSEFIPKRFWWSEWIASEKLLAFAHTRKPQQSSIDEESKTIAPISKPILSVFQFHENLPLETVLNVPLDDEVTQYRSIGHLSVTLIPKPTVLTVNNRNLPSNFRFLPHSSGAVSIFQIMPPNFKNLERKAPGFTYCINALHHNKTLIVSVDVGKFETLVVDICLFQNGQFVAVLGYPHFLHLLDVGIGHDPSHHVILDFSSLPMNPPMRTFLRMSTDTTSVTRPSHNLTLTHGDLCKTDLEINSALLLPLLLQKKIQDIEFTLAVIHYLLIHVGDVNAVKKILYEMGRSLSNPHLTEVFQEFIIANSFFLTRKQLMPNMQIFLNFLPFTSLNSSNSTKVQTKNYSIDEIQNSAPVATMLLSPGQRIFPHTVTDIWTQLWEISAALFKSTRFCHSNIAQKLLLSLQCYQPEALSRATTPMSPSSPMVCNSLGDIAALFSRRNSELQLPFIEQESCTANKQEYVYSVNLRELSMHLLKERRDWPLHGQTVAGKYMSALVDSARLLCHLICLTLHLQLTKNNKNKGFHLIDSMSWEIRLKLFMLFEHYSIALGRLACPLPHGFTPFFAYLGYRVLKYDQFLWHVRSGTFDLQIDLVKTIMADMNDSEEENVKKKLHLISLLPKSRGSRVLNGWTHQVALCLRARQHSSDLLSGVTSLARKSPFTSRVRHKGAANFKQEKMSPLDTFFHLLTAKANAADIDFGLLTEATMLSMQVGSRQS